MLLADTVAVVHGAAVVLLLTGAVIALWWPRVLWLHLPVSAAILAVNRAGRPCPLTDLELWLRADAGGVVYDGGYLGHYVFAPLGLDVLSPSVQAGIYTVAITPNAVGSASWRCAPGSAVPAAPTPRPDRS